MEADIIRRQLRKVWWDNVRRYEVLVSSKGMHRMATI